jgi:hypothetical protein
MEDVRLIFRAGLSDGDYRGQNEAKPFWSMGVRETSASRKTQWCKRLGWRS